MSAESSNDFEIKHPLQSGFTLWITLNKSKDDWRPQPIYTFSTVEDFWRLWNNITPATELRLGTDYFLFREGIMPAWEDDKNRNGGRFVLKGPSLNNISASDKARLDKIWLWMVLALIGESLPNSELIHGLVFTPRTFGTKLSLWTRDSSADDANREIGLKCRQVLELSPSMKLSYETLEKTPTLKFDV